MARGCSFLPLFGMVNGAQLALWRMMAAGRNDHFARLTRISGNCLMSETLNTGQGDLIPAWINGLLTPVEKLDVHRRGLKHKAVSVFVLDDDKVLVQQRAASKYHTPLLWANTCCTHPNWTEEPADCAVRRLNDELGIRGLTPVHCDQVEYRAPVGNGLIEHEVVEIFVAQARPDLVVEPNPDEVAVVKWVEFDELCADVERQPENYTPWLRIYLGEYRTRIFTSMTRS